jgi:hypothetical protein
MEPKQLDEAENRRLLDEFASTLASVRVAGESAEYKKPVRNLPKHGVFFRWPEQPEEDWIHPDDLELAAGMLPGGRIFQLAECENEQDHQAGYSVISYGDLAIRVLPAMWLPVEDAGYQVGDRVEVLAKNGTQQPFIGTLAEITYNPISRRTEYRIEVRSMVLKKKYFEEDFRPCCRLEVPLSKRARAILNKASVSF